MSNAKKCDICKKYYEPYEDKDGDNALRFCKGARMKRAIDACPSCLEAIKLFIKSMEAPEDAIEK